jgi:hypothetical protein
MNPTGDWPVVEEVTRCQMLKDESRTRCTAPRAAGA